MKVHKLNYHLPNLFGVFFLNQLNLPNVLLLHYCLAAASDFSLVLKALHLTLEVGQLALGGCQVIVEAGQCGLLLMNAPEAQLQLGGLQVQPVPQGFVLLLDGCEAGPVRSKPISVHFRSVRNIVRFKRWDNSTCTPEPTR